MTRPFPIFSLPLATVLLALLAAPLQAQETGDLPELQREALDLTNAARSDNGLSPLTSSDILDQAAQHHAADMLQRGYYDHVAPDGTTPFDRFLAAGGSKWAVSGENIATCEGCPTPPDAGRVSAFHKGWMQSPDHRKNILSPGFDSFGFGIAARGDTTFAVQTFSGPGADGPDDRAGLTSEAAQAAAFTDINAARAASGLDALERSEDLDRLAGRVLDGLGEGAGAIPGDLFGLLPAGADGWTSLAVQTASQGGSGVTLSGDDVAKVVSDWAGAVEADHLFGGRVATHMGFAARASGNGRVSAVAVFGGRE